MEFYQEIRQQERNGQVITHALVAGRIASLPSIDPGPEADHEREILRSEQQLFLQTMALLEELHVGHPAVDLRISAGHHHHRPAPQLLIGVVGRATPLDPEDAAALGRHTADAIKNVFPSSYAVEPISSTDRAFLSAILPRIEALKQAHIWELSKVPYQVRIGSTPLEIVGTYAESLDSMVAVWNAVARSAEPMLLSVRCEPVIEEEMEGVRQRLERFYQRLEGNLQPEDLSERKQARRSKIWTTPLIEGGRQRLENLIRSRPLLRMRIQVVSWGEHYPMRVLAALQAGLMGPADGVHASCQCEWWECRDQEKRRALEELAYVKLEPLQPQEDENELVPISESSQTDLDSWFTSSDTALPAKSWLKKSHDLLTVAEASAAWRLPLARRHAISGILFKRNPGFSPNVIPTVAQTGERILGLGTIIGNQSEGAPQYLSTEALTRHTLIVGEQGSGKSTTTQSLILQLWERGIPSLIIDPVSTEYRDLWQLQSAFRDKANGLCVFMPGTPGKQGTTLAFNPFCPQPGTSLDAHIMSLKDCFASALMLSGGWPELVGRAIRRAYEDFGWRVMDHDSNRQPITKELWQTGIFPSYIDLIKAVELEITRYPKGEFRSNSEAGLLGRLRDVDAGPLGALFSTRRPLDVERLIQRPVVIELRAIRQADAKSLIMLFLLVQLRQHYDYSLPRSSDLNHFVIVEEAHRLLSPMPPRGEGISSARDETISMMADMLAELRKVGVGIALVEQLPSRLEETLIKLPSIKVIHRVTAGTDRELLARATNMSDEQANHVATLSRGQAVFYTEGLEEPLLIQMANPWDDRESVPGRLGKPQNGEEEDALRQKVTEQTGGSWPAARKDEKPWNPCSWCKCGCQYRMSFLDDGWWLDVKLREIVQKARKAAGDGKQEVLVDLAAELWKEVEKVSLSLETRPSGARKLSLDERRCGLVLALEEFVRDIVTDAVRQGKPDVASGRLRVEQPIDELLAFLPENSGNR
jgi:DNA helicase HerA-like ATPase